MHCERPRVDQRWRPRGRSLVNNRTVLDLPLWLHKWCSSASSFGSITSDRVTLAAKVDWNYWRASFGTAGALVPPRPYDGSTPATANSGLLRWRRAVRWGFDGRVSPPIVSRCPLPSSSSSRSKCKFKELRPAPSGGARRRPAGRCRAPTPFFPRHQSTGAPCPAHAVPSIPCFPSRVVRVSATSTQCRASSVVLLLQQLTRLPWHARRPRSERRTAALTLDAGIKHFRRSRRLGQSAGEYCSKMERALRVGFWSVSRVARPGPGRLHHMRKRRTVTGTISASIRPDSGSCHRVLLIGFFFYNQNHIVHQQW
jgi:hypothetical protein